MKLKKLIIKLQRIDEAHGGDVDIKSLNFGDKSDVKGKVVYLTESSRNNDTTSMQLPSQEKGE